MERYTVKLSGRRKLAWALMLGEEEVAGFHRKGDAELCAYLRNERDSAVTAKWGRMVVRDGAMVDESERDRRALAKLFPFSSGEG